MNYTSYSCVLALAVSGETSFPLPRNNPCLIQTFVGCGSVFWADAIIRSQRSPSFCVLAEAAVDRART